MDKNQINAPKASQAPDKQNSHEPHSFTFIASQENSLVDSASRLFASLTQLKRNLQYYNLQQLRDYLLNELQLFQARTEALGYDRETIMIAHYALAATLDEIIDKTPLSAKLNWSKNSLLKTFKPELNTGDHFFAILDKLCQKPTNFVDLIEHKNWIHFPRGLHPRDNSAWHSSDIRASVSTNLCFITDASK